MFQPRTLGLRIPYGFDPVASPSRPPPTLSSTQSPLCSPHPNPPHPTPPIHPAVITTRVAATAPSIKQSTVTLAAFVSHVSVCLSLVTADPRPGCHIGAAASRQRFCFRRWGGGGGVVGGAHGQQIGRRARWRCHRFLCAFASNGKKKRNSDIEPLQPFCTPPPPAQTFPRPLPHCELAAPRMN